MEELRLRAFAAEFVGTFTLIFVGVAAIANNAGLPGIALAHGLAIAIMASATAAVSGGHLNPAVTAGVLVAGKIDPLNAVGYWISQLLGGIAGAFALRAVVPAASLARVQYGIPAPGQGITSAEAFVAEVILTFFLMFVIYGTAIDSRGPKVGALFIGLTVTADILAGGPISGAAMNPARYIGPALALGNFDYAWLYWLAPLLGAIAAALLYKFVLEEAVSTEDAKEPFPLGPSRAERARKPNRR